MSDSNLTNFLRFKEITDRYFDPSSASVVLDVGSRDGEVALYLKEHFTNSSVYAFDCNPESIQLCRRNLAGRPGVFLVEKAVADVTGVLAFYAIDNVNIGAASLYPFNPSTPQLDLEQRKIEVPSTTLRDWARQEQINQIDVIWMDLQGAELRALRGLEGLIDTVRVVYTEVEYKPIYDGQPLEGEVRRDLRRHGFVLLRQFHAFDAWFGDELYCHKSILPWSVRMLHSEPLLRMASALGRAWKIWILRIGRLLPMLRRVRTKIP